MAETVKKGDFVELDYTGILKELELVFDTTNAETAKKEDVFDPKMTYGPVSMCIGQAQILKGLDDALEGAEIGVEKEIKLGPEQAFGKKDGKLLKLIPTNLLKKHGINPMPGLQVNVDGAVGTIRTVSGGRTVVDFNHPFAGKEVIYKVKVLRKITDNKEKVRSLLHLTLNQQMDAIGVEITGDDCTVTLKKEFPKELLSFLEKRVVETMKNIKSVQFKIKGQEKSDKKTEPKKEAPEPKTEETTEEKSSEPQKQVSETKEQVEKEAKPEQEQQQKLA